MINRLIFFLCLLGSSVCNAQSLTIKLLSGDSVRNKLIAENRGTEIKDFRLAGTARTFQLSNGKFLVECYDREAIVFNSSKDIRTVRGISFIKTLVDRYKRNISYKFPIAYRRGQELTANAVKLDDYISDYPDMYNFRVYKLKSLLLYCDDLYKSAAIYSDIKSLVSDHPELRSIAYGDEESIETRFIHGEPYLDFEPNEHFVWPKDIPTLIKEHKLRAIDSNTHISDFRGILYRSDNGYYIVVDDPAQNGKNGTPIQITTATVFETKPAVDDAVKRYQSFIAKPAQHEHFYKYISDHFGDNFGKSVPQLLESLPALLNLNKKDITFDSTGMAIVDQAIYWRHDDYAHFDDWFSAVLAFYGECVIRSKSGARWIVRPETEDHIKVPHVILPGGEYAFDSNRFYKSLFEYPTPLALAGDWDSLMNQAVNNGKR